MSQASPVRPTRPARFPFVTHDGEFAALLGNCPRLAKVVAVDAHEGPVYAADEDALYFTTLPVPGGDGPRVDICRLDLASRRVAVVRADANAANGMALDREGGLVVCEQGTRSQHARITTVDRSTGLATPLVGSWMGRRLNSPNDVVVAGDGAVWFTDPSYGFLQGFRPEPQVGDHVYRYDPRSRTLAVVAESFDKPNGLAFSPDERTLYVTDSGANQEPGSYYADRPHHIKAFDVVGGRRLTNERVFAVVTPGFPDGLKVDSEGYVYASSLSGVQVFNPAGGLLGEISLPGAVNFTFGGPDRNVLYITADYAIRAAHLAATGPPRSKGA